MSIFETIRKRRSVRTFDGAELRPEDGDRILEYAEKAENPYGIRIAWRLLDAKEYGLSSPVIMGTDTFIAGKMSRVPHAEEAFGYSFEEVVLYAETLGVGTTWIAGTMNRGAFEKAMQVSDGEVMPCISPLGYPAERMSLRESLMRRGIRADSRLDFGEVFFDGGFDRPLTREAAGTLSEVLETVRLAPSAANRQPWRVVCTADGVHFYKKGSRGMDAGGWDIQKVDMGIALCHFALAGAEAGLQPVLTVEDPGLPCGGDMEYIASFAVWQIGQNQEENG